MTNLKELYKVSSSHSAFFTGGDVEWTEDGKNLLCQCGGKIQVLDIDEGKVISTISEEEPVGLEGEIEEDTILTFTLTKDNSSLIVAHRSGLLKAWDWKENKMVKAWRSLHKVPISRLASYKNSSLLATGATDASLRIWDLDHHACRHSLPTAGMNGVVSILLFLDELLFAAADDATIRAWDFASGTLKYTFEGHFSKVTSLEFLQDKKHMVSCGRDKVVIVWDICGGRSVRTIALYESLESLVLLPSAPSLPGSPKTPQKGIYIVCAGEKGMLRVWNADQVNELYVGESFASTSSSNVTQGITKLLYCPLRNSIAIVCSDHTIFFVATNDKLSVSKQLVGFSDEIFDVVFIGENQSHIAVATNSPVIKLYTVATMSCQLLKGHSDFVMSLASSPANPYLLVSGAKDNSIRLWLMNAEGSVSCIATGTRHTSSVTAIALGRTNSNLLVSAGEDTTLKIWSLPKKFNEGSIEALSVKCTEVAHEKDINGLCIAPNDKIMATASHDKTAKLWSTSDLSLMGVLKGHKRGVWSAKFSPVDQVLATTSADSTLRLWSLADLSCLKTFEGHGSSVLRAEFLSRGLQLVSVGSDGLMKLWCIKSSECMATFDEHDGKVWALAVSSDEKGLVTGGDDSKLLFWTDETETARLVAANEKHERIESEQKLDNLIHNKMLLPALELALQLERPATVLKIITQLQKDSADALEDVLRKLDADKKASLLRCSISWNSNSKQAYTAQVVLGVLLDDITTGEIRLTPSEVETLIMFTERHFNRIAQLRQDVQLLLYTANLMLPHAK